MRFTRLVKSKKYNMDDLKKHLKQDDEKLDTMEHLVEKEKDLIDEMLQDDDELIASLDDVDPTELNKVFNKYNVYLNYTNLGNNYNTEI